MSCEDWEDTKHNFLQDENGKWQKEYIKYRVEQKKEMNYCPFCGSELDEDGCTKKKFKIYTCKIKFTCPNCGKTSHLSENKLNEVLYNPYSKGKCPHCNKLFDSKMVSDNIEKEKENTGFAKLDY